MSDLTPDQAPDQGDDGCPSLLDLVAAAADVCLKPGRHAVRFGDDPGCVDQGDQDGQLLIDARDQQGRRLEHKDLELDLFRSGGDLNMTLTLRSSPDAPILWHGSHPIWMDPHTGVRCDRPVGGEQLEAFCRRLRALLQGAKSTADL